MSVFLAVKMDIHVGDRDFDTVVKESFPMEGVARMLQLPTLQWKIWTVDPERRQAAGFYLFADPNAAKQYAHQCVRFLQERPAISNVTAQLWTISEEQTRMTKGPIDLPMIQELPNT